MIEIQNLSKSRINLEMKDISIRCETGTLNLVLAPNSGGKSTLLKLVAGAIPKYDGMIRLNGKSIEAYKQTDSIGYVPSHMPLNPSIRVDDIPEMMEGTFVNWESGYFLSILKSLNLSRYKKVGELSKGYQKLLMLAIALAHRPKIYLLDEPTLGLDAKHKQILFHMIEVMLEDGKSTILLASNAIEDFEAICDQVIFLKEGQVVYSGNALDLINRYGIWRGEASRMPHLKVYGKVQKGKLIEVLVDSGTEGSVRGSVKEIIVLLGGKA